MSDDYIHPSPVTLVKDLAGPAAPGGSATDEASQHVRPTLGLAMRPKSSTSSADPSVALEPVERLEAKSQQSGQLLALADLMEGWAAALPRWDSQVTEPWFDFLERAYKAETSLAERLRRLPTCRLVMCLLREQVSLTLAGISVSSEQGLAAACRAWAQKARAQDNS